MSWLRRSAPTSHSEMLAGRTSRRTGGYVSTGRAMQHSVVWGAIRLRADLESLMPVDVYRKSQAAGGMQVQVDTPEVLRTPSITGTGVPMTVDEWIYSGRVALDRHGNNWGRVVERDGFNLPRRIDLVDPSEVSAIVKGIRFKEVRFGGEKIPLEDVWHERQFTSPGMPVGMSPIAHAAYALSGAISAQDFGVSWFENGAVPAAVFRNTAKTVAPAEASVISRRFQATVSNGGTLVHGNDWEYLPIQASAAESAFLEQMNYSDVELCRFFGVPGDLVDVAVNSSTINYANISQRNLQVLTMNLGGAVKRRETALTRLTRDPRFVKLNRDAVLAMDPKTRAEVIKIRTDARNLTPDEARELDDRAPLTEADYTQFERLFGTRTRIDTQTQGDQ